MSLPWFQGTVLPVKANVRLPPHRGWERFCRDEAFGRKIAETANSLPMSRYAVSTTRYKVLEIVNREANDEIVYEADKPGEDFWQLPRKDPKTGKLRGDCDDSTIEKLRRLWVEHNWPLWALSVVICKVLEPGVSGKLTWLPHLVLCAHTYVQARFTRQWVPFDVILDNYSQLPYAWDARVMRVKRRYLMMGLGSGTNTKRPWQWINQPKGWP